MVYSKSSHTFEPAAPAQKGGLFEAEIEAQLPEEEVKDCREINSGKAGTALIVPLWFASGFHRAMLSALSQEEEEYEALNFVAALSLGQRAYSIPTLGLPPLSEIIGKGVTAHDGYHSNKRSTSSWLPTAASTYSSLKRRE